MQCDKSCSVPEGAAAYTATFYFDRFGSGATNDKQLSFA